MLSFRLKKRTSKNVADTTFDMFFVVHIKSSLILGRPFPHECIVLSSAKLQISDFSTKKKISLMNMLNNSGPNIEPCGICLCLCVLYFDLA